MILQSDVFRIFFSFVRIHGKYFQPHPSGIAASMDHAGTLGPVLPLPGVTVTPCGKRAEPVSSVPSVSLDLPPVFLQRERVTGGIPPLRIAGLHQIVIPLLLDISIVGRRV